MYLHVKCDENPRSYNEAQNDTVSGFVLRSLV